MTKTAAAETAPDTSPAPGRFELVRLDRLVESPTNHRRTWGDLDELAASIRAKGVLEPILARPRTGLGSNLFEIVFGHRRFRAAKKAGLEAIPAMVRELSDLEVLEAQVVENLQRADVHPLEEAEGYEQLLAQKERPYTVDEIAAKVGKSKGYVYGRLKLLALCPEVRAALYKSEDEGGISASIGLLIARIPSPEVQRQALDEVVEDGDTGAPMSYRDAQSHILHKYTLRLADAPFDRGDAELVPGAGVCTTCPKRTGAQPELFADVKSPDVCTDPACFQAKKDAGWKREAEKAKAKGLKVLSATETKKVFDQYSSGVKYTSPYVSLGSTCPDDPKRRTWKQLLGKNAPEKVVARDTKGQVHELVDRAAALEAAKKAGLKLPKPPPQYDSAANREKHERESRERQAACRLLAAHLVARFESAEPDRAIWRLVIDGMRNYGAYDDALERRFGPDAPETAIDAAIAKMTDAQLRGFALELTLADLIYTGPYGGEYSGRKELLAWGKVDWKELQKRAREDLKSSAGKKSGGLVTTSMAAAAEHLGIRSEVLTWHHEDDGRVLGVAGDGLVYSIERGEAKALQAKNLCRWKRGREHGDWVPGVEGAKKSAEQAETERLGDARLDNAGDGALTKKELKGAAVARKKGRG